MGNCLVTRLKQSVDNPNLPEFTGFTLKITPTTATTEILFGSQWTGNPLWFYTDQDLEITSGDAFFSDAQGNPLPTPKSIHVTGRPEKNAGTPYVYITYPNTNPCTLHVSDKFGIEFGYSSQNNQFYVDTLEELKYMTQLTLLYIPNCPISGDISNILGLKNLKTFRIDGTQITGKLESFKDWDGLIEDYEVVGTGISGRASALPLIARLLTLAAGFNVHWTAGERTGGHALCMSHVVFGTAEEMDAYLIDTATATDHSGSATAIAIYLRGADYTPSAEAAAAKSTIESWGWTVSLYRYD